MSALRQYVNEKDFHFVNHIRSIYILYANNIIDKHQHLFSKGNPSQSARNPLSVDLSEFMTVNGTVQVLMMPHRSHNSRLEQ